MRHFLTLGAILVAAVGCGGATGTGNGLFGASASGGTSSGGASGASGAGASGGGASGMAGSSGGGTSGATGASSGGTSGAAAASGSGGCSGVFNCPLLMACPPGEEPVTPAGQCCPTSCGPSGAGGSTTGAECTSGADCPVPAVCKLCADGSTSCAHADCVNGKCSTTFPPCPVDAGSGTCDPLFCPASGGATPCCVGMACGLNYGAGCVSGAKVCTNDSQCPKSLAPCRLCPDGTAACPWSKCVSGQCTSGITTCRRSERQWRNVREWRGHRVGGHEGERWHFGHGCRVFSLVRAERRVRRRSEMRRRVLCRERVVRHEWQRAEVPVRNPARVRRRLVVRLEPRQRAVRFRLLPDFVSAVTVVLARPLL